MAKQNEAKASAPAVALAKSEIVDTRTGEIVQTGEHFSAGDELDKTALSVLASNDIGARLKRAKDAKKEDFGALEKDFWAPGVPGTPEAVLQGVYLGSVKMGRLIQHALAVEGKNGKPLVVRLNGRHSLTAALKQCEPRDIVRIEYLGESTTMGLSGTAGNRIKQWDVRKIG